LGEDGEEKKGRTKQKRKKKRGREGVQKHRVELYGA